MDKCVQLTDRLELVKSGMDPSTKAVIENNARSRRRAMKQLEADEKQVIALSLSYISPPHLSIITVTACTQTLEKLSSTKTQAMQKVAADTVGPKLEQVQITFSFFLDYFSV
jgi:hypothetical protein